MVPDRMPVSLPMSEPARASAGARRKRRRMRSVWCESRGSFGGMVSRMLHDWNSTQGYVDLQPPPPFSRYVQSGAAPVTQSSAVLMTQISPFSATRSIATRRRFPPAPGAIFSTTGSAPFRRASTAAWSTGVPVWFFQRAAIAVFPRATRSSAVSDAAEALPPLRAPSFDRTRAAADAAALGRGAMLDLFVEPAQRRGHGRAGGLVSVEDGAQVLARRRRADLGGVLHVGEAPELAVLAAVDAHRHAVVNERVALEAVEPVEVGARDRPHHPHAGRPSRGLDGGDAAAPPSTPAGDRQPVLPQLGHAHRARARAAEEHLAEVHVGAVGEDQRVLHD